MVQGNVRGRDLGSVVADIKHRIRDRVQLPAGVFVEFVGQFENQQQAMTRLAIIVPIAILCVFLLLWMSVGSAGQAMIIITNVPLALIGGILGLWLTGEYLSVPASVGFIALFGIAIQDGVVMVSYFNQLRQRGKKLNDALCNISQIFIYLIRPSSILFPVTPGRMNKERALLSVQGGY